MSQNQLKGSLPRELGLLTDLQRLELSDNALTGTIPTTELLGGALSSLTGLDLSQNKLTGPIVIPPVEVGLVRNEVHHLNLCENKLTGVIPQAIYDQPYLKTVSLCSNRFSGSISNRIQSLSFLSKIILQNKRFRPDIL
jgi:Leucine-rich repeat (LRR) protein